MRCQNARRHLSEAIDGDPQFRDIIGGPRAMQFILDFEQFLFNRGRSACSRCSGYRRRYDIAYPFKLLP